jgi:hypothetical protein
LAILKGGQDPGGRLEPAFADPEPQATDSFPGDPFFGLALFFCAM